MLSSLDPAAHALLPQDSMPLEGETASAPRAKKGTDLLLGRVQALRERHAKVEIALFFSLGFALDLFTLGRIDNVFNLVQQGVYLLALGGTLLWEQRSALGLFTPQGSMGKLWRFHHDLSHFLFGNLLSSYTLFYFKSASGLSAAGFMVVLISLLLANEAPRFRRLGPWVRMGLFSLCLTSYFAYLLPVLAGRVRGWLFGLAVLCSLAVSVAMHRCVRCWSKGVDPADAEKTRRGQILFASLAVQVALLGLYAAHAIPPVPLSVSYLGIYHQVERAPEGGYLLSHQRPSWRFWERGDQQFLARSGDRIYVFTRIFAPRGFRDQVNVRWSRKDARQGWVTFDAIPLAITGGRGDGFGGFAYKANYAPGEWRVQVESEDGRVMGEIPFWVEEDRTEEPRQFLVERR